MSNEAQIIDNPSNTVVPGVTTVSESYQAQNTRAEAVSNGVDNSYIYASGSSIILPICGGIDVNGVFYAITTEATLTPSADGTYYIYLSGSGDNLTPTLGTNKGTFDPVKNGYYYSGYRVLNWEIEFQNDIFIIGRIQFNSSLTLDNAVKVVPCPKEGCILDANGKGMPEIPDNPDGVIYQNAKDWVDGVDGWYGSQITLSILNNKLTGLTTGTDPQIKKDIVLSGDKSVFLKFSCDYLTPRLFVTYTDLTFTEYILTSLGGGRYTTYLDIDVAKTTSYIRIDSTTESGVTTCLDYIYIGDGTNITGAPDHSGTQNPAINTAVTPADYYKGIKLMHFNGVTSNLEYDTPVIGTTGTLRFLIRREREDNFEILLDNRSSVYDGIALYLNNTGGNTNITLQVQNSSGGNTLYDTGITPVISVFCFGWLRLNEDKTTIDVFLAGDYVKTITLSSEIIMGSGDLYFGKRYTNLLYFRGDLSINYTTRQLSAAEVKSDYNNPRQYFNQTISETALPYAIPRLDSDGNISATNVNLLDSRVDQAINTTSTPTLADLIITGLGNMKAYFTNWILWLNQSVKTSARPTFNGLELSDTLKTNGNDIDSEGGDIKTGSGDLDNGTGNFLVSSSPTKDYYDASSSFKYFSRGVFDVHLTATAASGSQVILAVQKKINGMWYTVTRAESVYPDTVTDNAYGIFSSGDNVRYFYENGVPVEAYIYYTKY